MSNKSNVGERFGININSAGTVSGFFYNGSVYTTVGRVTRFGAWEQVVVVNQSQQLTMYVSMNKSTTGGSAIDPGNNGLRIGRRNRTSELYFNGRISQVQVYNRAMTESEILYNYQSMLPRFIGENIVTNGLVFYVDAGYYTSYPQTGTTWYDVSGYNNNGTLTNGPTYTSSNGGGIVFDGVDDYAIVSNTSELINTTTSGTVDFFYKLNSVPDSNYEDVWSIRNSSFGRIFWYENSEITNPSPIMRLVWKNSDDSLNSVSLQIPYDSLLVYNITFTYVVSGGSTTISIYKNGSLIESSSVNKVLANPANQIRLGTDFAQYSNCTIFTYRVYNRVLTDTEITQNYNAQKGRFGL